jgi:hypothetical protein
MQDLNILMLKIRHFHALAQQQQELSAAVKREAS